MDGIKKSQETDEEQMRKFVYENYYKVRDCDFYELEYKECKSIKGRFQQYYVYGETLDCSKWKEDLHNCKKSLTSKDSEVALASIIHHENERLEKRIKAHQANDVWQKRSEPPPDWNAELPDWLVKRQENSFIDKKDLESQLCIIS